MQKFVIRNIRDEILGHETYIYINLPTNQENSHTLQRTMWLHLYKKQCKIGSYTCAFIDIDGATISISHQVTKAAKWSWLVGKF